MHLYFRIVVGNVASSSMPTFPLVAPEPIHGPIYSIHIPPVSEMHVSVAESQHKHGDNIRTPHIMAPCPRPLPPDIEVMSQ